MNAPEPMHARGSLRTRWTATLLAVGALPLALLALASVTIQRRGLETAERQLEVAVIDHVAETLDHTLREAGEATHRVGQMLTEGRISDDGARLELARDALARADALAEVAIYSPDGQLLDAITRKDAAAASAKPPTQFPVAALAGKALWLPPLFEGGVPLLRYAEGVVRDGERRAFVLGTLAPGALAARLDGISRDRFEGRGDGVLLLDGATRVLAGGGTGPLAVGATLRGTDILAALHLADDPFGVPLALATEFRSADGEEMVGSLRSLPDHRFAIAVRRPTISVYAALASARKLLIGAGAFFAVLAIVAGAVLAARTIRPINALVELTRAYARREFDARSPVRTGDELELLGASLSQMADELDTSEKEIMRRAAVEADLSRYLPAEVAKSIAAGTNRLELGGERRVISVLFADVVAFTSFSEGAPPEKVVAFLNDLFTVLTEVVFRHGGTVDKFIGDCVMAIFGAPNDQPDHASRALAAAEDMHRFVEANAPAWKNTYGVDIKLGIGVNTGEALVGNLGSAARMEYTAIGDAVNVAARLEGLARPGQTLVTEDTAKLVGDEFVLASLGEHPLRGKKQSVTILELQ